MISTFEDFYLQIHIPNLYPFNIHWWAVCGRQLKSCATIDYISPFSQIWKSGLFKPHVSRFTPHEIHSHPTNPTLLTFSLSHVLTFSRSHALNSFL